MSATQFGSGAIAKLALWISFMLVWGAGKIHAQDETAAGEDENQRLLGQAIAASRDEKWAEATGMLDALIKEGNAPAQRFAQPSLSGARRRRRA